MKVIKNFIAGKFVEPSSGEYFVKDDPATGRPSLQVARSSAEDAAKAIAAANTAQTAWARISVKSRCEFLEHVAQGIEKRFEDFARAECEDTGKPLSLCRSLDVPRAVLNFRFFADFAARSPERRDYEEENSISYSLRQPLGVVALITPWNLPIYLLSWKLAPALAMGNAVVAKPSEYTPQTANLLAEVLRDCNLPEGLYNVLHGPGAEAAEPVIASPEVKAVSFTGGTATGTRVAKLAAEGLKKISLELGGKNPTLVFADADLEEAAAGVARSSFLNQGQICLCGERILIEKKICQEFTEKFLKEAKKFVAGPPMDEKTNHGALISRAHLEKVEGYVKLARDLNGKILLGGRRAPGLEGFFFEPTVIDGLSPSSRVAQEEIFGPVVTLHSFDSEEEAIRLANDVPYGLSASCWTKDSARQERLGRLIEAGTVWMNTWLLRDLRVPFGGVKKSGLGREGGDFSLDFFSEYKTVSMRKANP
jgi:aminomuconate-semialdehyde/2-hydroxymuconate-6-semialdehyde dehydrogenase